MTTLEEAVSNQRYLKIQESVFKSLDDNVETFGKDFIDQFKIKFKFINSNFKDISTWAYNLPHNHDTILKFNRYYWNFHTKVNDLMHFVPKAYSPEETEILISNSKMIVGFYDEFFSYEYTREL